MLKRDVGVDFGTTTTSVHVEGRGIVLSESSIVVMNGNPADRPASCLTSTKGNGEPGGGPPAPGNFVGP